MLAVAAVAMGTPDSCPAGAACETPAFPGHYAQPSAAAAKIMASMRARKAASMGTLQDFTVGDVAANRRAGEVVMKELVPAVAPMVPGEQEGREREREREREGEREGEREWGGEGRAGEQKRMKKDRRKSEQEEEERASVC